MKLKKQVSLSISLILASQSVTLPVFAQNTQEVSAVEVPVANAPGVSATIIKDVRAGKITTMQQIEYRLKNLTIEEREVFLNEAKARLLALQAELSTKVMQANTAGKTYVNNQLSAISEVSAIIFLVGGISAQWMTMLRKDYMMTFLRDSNSKSAFIYDSQNIKFQRFVKTIAAIALISGVTSVVTKLGEAYISQDIQVSAEEINLINQKVAMEQRNVDMLLNDLLVSREITVALNGSKIKNATNSSVSVNSILQLDDETKELFKQTLITNTEGAEVFIKTAKNLPIKSRIALLNDAIKALELKESELNIALSDTNLNRKIAISNSLSDLKTMGFIGAIATGGSAAAHYLLNSASAAASKDAYQIKFIRAVRVLAGLTAFQAVAATAAGWVNSYYMMASKEQVEILKGQVGSLKNQLDLIRKNLREAEEINSSTMSIQKQ